MAVNTILLIIVIFALANMSLIGLFDLNLINIISSIFGKYDSIFEKLLTIIILIASIIFFINKDLYESFNGETKMPIPKIDVEPNGNLKSLIMKNLPPKVKVIYWATIPKTDIKEVAENETIAYGGYPNQGVITTNSAGSAIFKFVTPIAYKDASGNIIKPHVNYRYWDTKKNMFSKLYKEYI